ncbi:outer membrane protein assembly factor BamB [Roseateles oligotrophus]|uniref:Outer membrane protein assembly factor BamB n=1 Tax=Roseateles oligotrophus TaxID=1769250 RepID=A0ABT2Y904_9BURK|nr:outer membrane protein assembly factor BamB [Roseateles oligotrophus]MCV2366779.1 outer membrane protein assembly factor BamB [Roseateles oligotrophus]
MIGKNFVAAALLVGLLAGCSVFSSSTATKPAVLEQVTPAIAGTVVWTARLDSVKFPLSIAAVRDQFVVAGGDGTVQSLQASDGRALWSANVGQKLAAGVGSDGRFAAVVTTGNEVVALEEGQVIWRKTLPTPVVAAPLVAGERVFVLTVDRQVHAFDAKNGDKIWILRRPGEPLTLAQPGVIAAYKDTLIVGQGTRMAGVDPLRGTIRWEASVASPRGTNEVERLADLVGPIVRSGETLCARAFQSAVGCVNAERGSLMWTRNVGGTLGVGGDAKQIVGGDASDRLSAWSTPNGDVLWTAEQFLNRRLSSPLLLGATVIVGDFEGYVHFLSAATGKTQLRLSTDGSAVVAAPVVLGNTILIATRNGGLFAMRPE